MHGPEVAARLPVRLDDLRAAQNMALCAVLPGKFHALTKDRRGQFAVWLTRAVRLVFEPVAEPMPRRVDGSIDMSRITTVRVVYIGNYHD